MKIKQNTKERGITLIALIVTIIVLIVLAVVSINAIFGADGLIEQARKTDLIADFTVYIEEKKTYDSEKLYENSNYDGESLNAGRTTLIYNTQEDTEGNIQTVIPSMSNEMAEKFEIIKGEFLLYEADELEREVATELGIKLSPYLIENGVLLSANENLELQAENGVVTIPERVTEIGAGAFSGVEGLKEVIIPGTVKIIDNDAFSYNTEIEKITIEDGVLRIGANAFKGCSSLIEVTMPDSVVEMGNNAFDGCTNLEKIQLSNNITAIEYQTFSACTNLTTINIPNSLVYIDWNAFSGCRKLDNIYIPTGVTYIASSAFGYCTSLKNLTIDENNTAYEIEDGIIYATDNSTLIMLATIANEKTVTIREGVKKLESSSLMMCTSMTTLNLPSSLEYIRGDAFPTESTKLVTINIPESNKYYKAEDGYIYSKDGKELVYVVASKKNININENVETIKLTAIFYTTATEIVIPDNVKTIEDYALRQGWSLKSLHIGKGVSNLSTVFKSWGNVEGTLDITIDEENPYYKIDGNLILTKDGKKVVTYVKYVESQIIPEGVETIENGALADFKATEIILPSTLKTIEAEGISYCGNLTTITIPSSVETIATNAFSSCINLAEIRIEKEAGSISGAPWSVPKGDRAVIWLK